MIPPEITDPEPIESAAPPDAETPPLPLRSALLVEALPPMWFPVR
jgi:hypothetical protein